MPTSRRDFLYLLLGSSITAFARPTFTLAKFTDSGTHTTFVSILADFFDNKTSARIVGNEYLRYHPAEADADWLADQIFRDDIDNRIEYLRSGRADRKELIKRMIHEDFKLGRIVHVRNWMLSQTEAHLCAIAVLA
jgi:hypothetical protein